MSETTGKPFYVTEEYLSKININDPFFDSFKQQYINFKNWFQYLAQAGKKAWVSLDNNKIHAFLLLEEDECIPGAAGKITSKKRLNISKMKITAGITTVSDLFLKISIREALARDIDELYFTCFPGTRQSVLPWLTEMGFRQTSRKTNQEDIYIKQLKPPPGEIGYLEIMEKYYPSFYDGIKVRKFILPLSPSLHKKIFADSSEYRPSLFESAGELFVEGNTIKKRVFLKDQKTGNLARGDILLFYRSGDLKAITSLGIVEDVLKDPEQVNKPADRGVWILFRWHFHLPVYPDYQFILDNKITGKLPYKLIRIDHRRYKAIMEKCNLNSAFRIQ